MECQLIVVHPEEPDSKIIIVWIKPIGSFVVYDTKRRHPIYNVMVKSSKIYLYPKYKYFQRNRIEFVYWLYKQFIQNMDILNYIFPCVMYFYQDELLWENQKK